MLSQETKGLIPLFLKLILEVFCTDSFKNLSKTVELFELLKFEKELQFLMKTIVRARKKLTCRFFK